MRAPIYSHLVYDVVPGEDVVVDRPDILIFEGLNVLQPPRLPRDGMAVPYVSDFLDFSVYIDAEEELLRKWYVDRFMALRLTAFRKPESFFRRYAEISEEEALATAHGLWDRINLPNLQRKHLPHPPARRPDPAQGREPRDRRGGAQEVVRGKCHSRRM